MKAFFKGTKLGGTTFIHCACESMLRLYLRIMDITSKGATDSNITITASFDRDDVCFTAKFEFGEMSGSSYDIYFYVTPLTISRGFLKSQYKKDAKVPLKNFMDFVRHNLTVSGWFAEPVDPFILGVDFEVLSEILSDMSETGMTLDSYESVFIHANSFGWTMNGTKYGHSTADVIFSGDEISEGKNYDVNCLIKLREHITGKKKGPVDFVGTLVRVDVEKLKNCADIIDL